MDPRELTALVTAVSNALYSAMSASELAVLAAVFVQLGDTLATLAAQEARGAGEGEKRGRVIGRSNNTAFCCGKRGLPRLRGGGYII